MEMYFEEREGGLIIPHVKQIPPEEEPEEEQRIFGPLEIEDEDDRIRAHRALCTLWHAMGLIRGRPPGGGIRLPTSIQKRWEYETKLQLWRLLATSLLGPDAPEEEEWC